MSEIKKPLRKFGIEEATQHCEVKEETILSYIRHEWLILETHDSQLDEEDIARAQLIFELQTHLGVNDEAVPIILHLLDQLHSLRHEVKRSLSGV